MRSVFPILLGLLLFGLDAVQLRAQRDECHTPHQRDSLHVLRLEHTWEGDKLFHAEPLFMDLVRDLGARRGERELGLAWGQSVSSRYVAHLMFLEYEWAPADNWGLEVELPMHLHYTPRDMQATAPDPHASTTSSNRSHTELAARAGVQHTLRIWRTHHLSVGMGYYHQSTLASLGEWAHQPMVQRTQGLLYGVMAKRWGYRWHLTAQAGPRWQATHSAHAVPADAWLAEIHTSVQFLLPGTPNFAGLEVNSGWGANQQWLTLRPQLRLSLAHHFLVGLALGIPIVSEPEHEHLSGFVRLMWEPSHRHHHHHPACDEG
jgi:hypothetical protein